MEDSQSGNSGKPKLQRYPLRSGTKSKETPVALSESSNSISSKRSRAASSVSKSISVLDFSGKEKSAKVPRRLSIPTKSGASPAPRPPLNITPISEVRAKRADTTQRKADTPILDISKSSTRKKFCVLSSSSYWLSQIKLSEAAAKHSVSLGFFKLAMEAGCEPLQKMRDELTSYARRHNLEELGEPVKELLECYNIGVETTVQVSETISQVPDEETRSSDEEIRSSSSTVSIRNMKPKATPKPEPAKATPGTGSTKKSIGQKSNTATTRTRVSLTKNSVNSRSLRDTGSNKSVKKTQKPIKQDLKKREKISAIQEGSIIPSDTNNAQQENKENLDITSTEEISLAGLTII